MSSSFAEISKAISNNADPFSPPPVYFSKETDAKRNRARTRTTSVLSFPRRASFLRGVIPPSRRTSHDEISLQNEHRKFLIPVNKTLKELLETEGNKDQQITIDDHGPKTIFLGTLESNGFRKVDVRGNYVVSNLLQELWLAKMYGMTQVTLDEVRLTEDPVHRLSRIIRDTFWTNLTRQIDASSIRKVATDTKDWTANPRPRIYIPHGQQQQFDYYTKIAKELKAEDEAKETTMTQKQKHDDNFKVFDLEVVWLPEHEITGEFVRDLNERPGLLAIAMEEYDDPKTGERTLRGLPFVVPGGRFNELYGWDSYMIALGLIINGKVDLAMSMVKHFCFCIKYYGKIFNANRSYYLGRSQPPFLTDMALAVYEEIKEQGQVALDFLKEATLAAIKEYHGIWMSAPRIDPKTGLSRYRPVGVGVPPETEASHFVHYLQPYADKHSLSFEAFVQEYNYGRIKEPELDEYFLHDRAVRESGHDTSYRLEKVAANLATIDLNSLLYKYETDIAMIIRKYFKNSLVIPAEYTVAGDGRKPNYVETSAFWDRAAKKRRAAVEQYMWDDEAGMYFDYDTVKEERHEYETATTFWSMWAGLATPARATALVEKALPKFEEFGGLASGTEKSRGEVGLDRPNRQWDYPYGWAPQQMLAWRGLHNYGYRDDAARLAYKWLYMVTKAFHDFNGVVVEKYNVTEKQRPHAVLAEYGNQGADFKGVATEGFGWVNASYVCGMSLMNVYMQRALGSLVPWDKSPFH